MTPAERIAGIRERIEAATAGPWTACGADRGGCECRQVSSADGLVALAVAHTDDDGLTGGEGYTIEQAKRNAVIIANAPADLAYLLACLDAAEALAGAADAAVVADRDLVQLRIDLARYRSARGGGA